MRVAILSSLVYDTTFPLAKYLSDKVNVDLFCFVSKTFLTMPMMDLSKTITNELGFIEKREAWCLLPKSVQQYFHDSSIKFSLVICSGGKQFTRDISTIKQVSKKINSINYDAIHFIGENVYFPLIYPKIKSKNIVHTFHENLSRVIKGKGIIKKILLHILYNKAVQSCSIINFHSENVRKNFLNETKIAKLEKTSVIPFGLLEGYGLLADDLNLTLPNTPYILFFGYIVEYKGVDVLLKAITEINKKNNLIDFVIAGRDGIGLETENLPRDITFFNRFLSEEEIVTLLKKCHSVVMPYKSASQSGIPNTAFVFNKPVIASRIDGINEVIKDGVNGLLVEPNNYIDLADKIEHLILNNKLYQSMVQNIQDLREIEHLNWNVISQETIELYKTK